MKLEELALALHRRPLLLARRECPPGRHLCRNSHIPQPFPAQGSSFKFANLLPRPSMFPDEFEARRRCRRRAIVVRVTSHPNYIVLENIAPTALPDVPNPEDLTESKRGWEERLAQWRWQLKALYIARGIDSAAASGAPEERTERRAMLSPCRSCRGQGSACIEASRSATHSPNMEDGNADAASGAAPDARVSNAMTVEAVSESRTQFIQPCVDCGLWTGSWCECYGSQRMPNSFWEPGQHTPLCRRCDALRGECHYCRGVLWCTPIPHGIPPQG